jgi:hypothetical protein
MIDRYFKQRVFAIDLFLYLCYSIAAFYIFSDQSLDFITSDSLYLVALEKFGIFDFSPPPSTYYFPDFFLYFLTKGVLSDPFQRLIASGFVQLFLLVFIFRFYSNYFFNFIFISILLVFSPSLSITISFHLLSIVLFFIILSAPKKYKNIFLITLGLMDPLVLLAWSIVSFAKVVKSNTYEPREQAALMISWLLCYLNGDLHPAHNKMLVMLVLALFASSFARHFQLSTRLKRYLDLVTEIGTFRIIMCAVIVAMLIANQPDRYVIPLMGMALLNPAKKPDIENFFAQNFFLKLTPLILVIISFVFSFQALSSKIDQYLKNYDCLINSLSQDKIQSVATDYWLSKFILIRSNEAIRVMSFNFERGRPYIWISPYKMASQEISYFIMRNKCDIGPIHCNSDWIKSVARREKYLCEDYSLFTAFKPITFDSVSNKIENIEQNLFMHLQKFRR